VRRRVLAQKVLKGTEPYVVIIRKSRTGEEKESAKIAKVASTTSVKELSSVKLGNTEGYSGTKKNIEKGGRDRT